MSVFVYITAGVGHGFFSDDAYGGAAVHTGVIGAGQGVFHHAYTGVSWVLLREIADESDAVSLGGVTVSGNDELRCTGLACDSDEVRLRLSAPWPGCCRAEMVIPDDVVQGTFDIPERAGGADRRLDDFGSERLDVLSVTADGGDEHGAHHPAVVSDGVVEHEYLHGAQFDGVAVRHLTECDGVSRHVDAHFVGAGYLAIDAVHESHALDAADELTCRAFVGPRDEFGEGDVRRHREGRADGEDGVHLMRVGMFDGEILPGLAADGDGVIDTYLTVIECGGEGDGLEGRTGLDALHGVVLRLVVKAVLFGSVEVSDGADEAGLGLHEDGATPLSLFLRDLRHECVLDDVLEVGVDGSDDIEAVLRLFDSDGLIASADLLDRTESVDASELFVEAFLEPGVTGTAFAIDTADSAASEESVGFDAAVLVLEENTGFILAFLDETVLLEVLALEVVDTMVADAESFLSAAVGVDDAGSVFSCGPVTDDAGEVEREGVDMGGEECAAFVMQSGYARIHIDVVLRHAGGQELTVAVKDVTARGGDGLMRRYLFLRYLEPLVAFDGLDIDDLAQHGDEAGEDDDEDDRKTPDSISLLVAHLIFVGGMRFSWRALPRSLRASTIWLCRVVLVSWALMVI